MKFLNSKLSLVAASLAFSMAVPQLAMADAKQVTMAISSTVDSLDPYNANSSITRSVTKAFYEGLFEFDEKLKIKPLLATGYTVNSDGTVYTIKLRKGVKFHDGTDFNAEAVKFTLDRVLDKSNGLSRWSQFNRIKNVAVVDANTVTITLSEPFSAFVSTLAHAAAMMMSPTAVKRFGNKDIAFHPVGTGPFEFTEWNPSSYVKVKKFAGYWRQGYPKVDGITFRFVTDNNTRSSVIQTGEAQFAFPVPYEQANILKNNPKVVVVNGPSVADTYISLNNLQKPFDDVRVRQAINYAINKEALAKVAFSGYAKPMEGVIPQGVEYAVKMQPWPHNPAKAKELLKEAGYPNGFSTTLWSGYNDSTATKVVQFVQQQLAQVGVKLSVEMLEAGQRVQRVKQVPNPKDAGIRMYYIGWASSTGEADWVLRPLLATSAWPPAFENTAYYSNPVVDDAVKNALLTTDEAKKHSLYKSAQEQIWKDAPWAFLVTRNNVYVHAKDLSGVHVMPDGNFYYSEIQMK
ncbi:glutathione transport system substrate-binding protein [Polaromonas sp. OV174]|uniref:glutathione ABC transporter substrate-binding protein GsiB n=1 Tax=Polaromonas sp. OV174 TaxID=1855300 RepID=UPI0008E8A931|nr:glutathione ABC transporter substrate-binding protein GsiB [Polaromonas sp. OV174]SFC21497.1 glutathione transport system substrate-binding protein [Polaromonas sp. OV174]